MDYNYHIVITVNNKVYFKERKYQTIKNAENRLRTLRSRKVLFPIRFYDTKDAQFRINLLKKKEEGDLVKTVRDEIGRIVNPFFDEKEFIMVKNYPFFVEEKMMVFGYEDKLDAKQIARSIVFKGLNDDKATKNICYYQNKLLIVQPDGDIDIVVCKNIPDAKRLHDTYLEMCFYNEVRQILFTERLSRRNAPPLIDIVVEKTGWSRHYMQRVATTD